MTYTSFVLASLGCCLTCFAGLLLIVAGLTKRGSSSIPTIAVGTTFVATSLPAIAVMLALH